MIGARLFGRMWRSRMRGGDTPSARAASTNSCSLTLNTCPRTSRVRSTQPVTANAKNSSTSPPSNCPNHVWRSEACKMMKNRKVGKAYMTSTKRISRLSQRPPSQPESRPSVVPIKVTMAVGMKPTTMLTRAPYSSRLSSSRARLSVPSRYRGSCPAIQNGGALAFAVGGM